MSGLFYLVDSECLMPSGTDASLFQKIQNNYRNSRAAWSQSKIENTDETHTKQRNHKKNLACEHLFYPTCIAS